MMNQNMYAPVERFEILQEPVPAGVIRGIAGPSSGPKPCALALVVGGSTIATAAATAFSPDAQQREIRLGWCGFEIGGMAQAVALGEDVELRCLVSDRTQARWDGAALAAGLQPPRPRPLKVGDMLRKVRDDQACTDVQRVLPFAEHLVGEKGGLAFLQASYRYFLNRLPEASAEAEFSGDYSSRDAIFEFWQMMMRSREFEMRKMTSVPGPFDPLFPFPLQALDV